MASPFWTYFSDRLKWIPVLAAGPVQGIAKGTAHRLDGVKEDGRWMRDQWFPGRCEDELVPEHGLSRGLIRHHKETPEMFRQRVVNAWNWHMMGGKQQGLPKILQFYGFGIAEIENLRKYQPARWAEFQIGLHNPSDLAEQNNMLATLETLVWLVNEYKPARSVLFRLYNDVYNITPLVWSHGKYSEHFYTHFSGVPASCLGGDWQGDGLILSFGHNLGILVERGEDYGSPIFSGWQDMGIEARYADAAVWSHFSYSDSFPEKHGFTFFNLASFDGCEKISTSHGWQGAWDARHWEEPATWDRALPEWIMESRQTARSELVYSGAFNTPEAGMWGGLNACYGVPTAVIVKNPPVWGDYRYSDDTARQEISIHEQTHATLGLVAVPRENNDPETFMEGVCGIVAAPLHNQTWTGKWDKRCWWNYGAFIRFEVVGRGLSPEHDFLFG